MAKGYVIYNPLAGSGESEADARLLPLVTDDELEYFDITRITNYAAFLRGLAPEDYLVIVGGDGTLNRFVNATDGIRILQEILYFPTGSGNDFARDLEKQPFGNPFPVTGYLKNLPRVEVNGRISRFLNGVGFGIDGYCCQRGDVRKATGKPVNYTSIAIKGLLSHFLPRSARVTVDGKTFSYRRVWLAPTMYGTCYGGGMRPAPAQSRHAPEQTLSVMLFHNAGRLRALMAFPGIFRGTHIVHKDMVAIHTGHEITVEFDRPTPLQIDGETIPDVTVYTARSPVRTPRPVSAPGH